MSRSRQAKAKGKAVGRRRKAQLATMQVEWLTHLAVDVPEKALTKLGNMAIVDIKADTAQGKKGNQRKMPDLEESYEVEKLKDGLTNIPDLRKTGMLMSQFTILNHSNPKRGSTRKKGYWVEIGFTLSGTFGPMGGQKGGGQYFKKGDASDIIKFRTLKKYGRDPLALSKRDIKRFAKQFVKEGLLAEMPGPPPKPRKRPRKK